MDIHVNSDVLAIVNQTFLELVGSSSLSGGHAFLLRLSMRVATFICFLPGQAAPQRPF